VIAAAALAFYSFVGFETSANMVEETKDPRRSYPAPCSAGCCWPGCCTCSSGSR
jgi:amino acid transporter